MPVVDFDVRINLRVRSDLIVKINNHLEKNDDRYESLSHYIRCCIIKDLEGDKK